MAEQRLPAAVTDILETPLGDDVTVPTVDPIQVNTRDEVADVADALNTVQDSALDLAVEQAVLRRNIADSFVNLGRRNQNLLGRQLDFITELEANETDPDTLSNLFRLDHLATRMRRNAESLLVLAGIEPPRQWAAPVRLTDVIRAALGEVEDYQRVTVRGVEPATIIGSAAADLAHLLAELIENALVFSPPDQTVDIRGRLRPTTSAPTERAGTRWRSSTRGSACRPATSRRPTAGWRAPRASRSPRRSTSATTWPATSPPATASGSRSTTRPATASRPRSTCRSTLLTSDAELGRPDAGTAGSRGDHRHRVVPGAPRPGTVRGRVGTRADRARLRRHQPRRARPVRRGPAGHRSGRPGPTARAGADPHRQRSGQAVAARQRRRARRHRARRRAARQPVEHRQQPDPLGPGGARPAATAPGGPGAGGASRQPVDPVDPHRACGRCTLVAGPARPRTPEPARPTWRRRGSGSRRRAAATVAVPPSPAGPLPPSPRPRPTVRTGARR